MIGFLKGRVDTVHNGVCIIECNGVGYLVNISVITANQLKVGDEARILTSMIVRENDISLYGFIDIKEREMFDKLLSVSGVGAKSALGILGGITVADLALCIIQQSVSTLVKIKGVGKKTAERILLELRDKFVQDNQDNEGITTNVIINKSVNSFMQEAQQALMVLGFKQAEIARMTQDITGNSAEEILAKALRNKN